MKIVVVLHQFLPRYTTGTELYVYELARVLEKMGHEVVLFTGEDDGRSFLKEHDSTFEGLRVHRFTRHPGMEAEPVLAEYASPLAEAAFGRFLDTVQPDLVHFFHLYGLGGGLMDAVRVRGLPYWVHLMDFWFLCPRIQMLDFKGGLCPGPRTARRCARCAGEVDGNLRPLRRALEGEGALESLRNKATGGDAAAHTLVQDFQHLEQRWPYLRERLRQAARVISPSEYLRGQFIENGLEGDRIHLLRYGIAPHGSSKRTRRPERRIFRFGYMGNLATFKGAHIALEAFSGLDGDRFRFDVYGDFFFRERGQMDVCKTMVEGDARIEMRGPFHRRDLGKVLDGIDALVVPSLWHENSPFVVLEALGAGTPVLASRVGGIEEVVREGVDGLLFERGDVEALRGRMEILAAGQGLREGEPASIPTLQSNAEDLVRLYREALDRDRAPGSDESEGIDRSLVERLYRTVEVFGGIFQSLGSRTRKDRDVLKAFRRAGRLEEELEGHRQSLRQHADRYQRLRDDLHEIEAYYKKEIKGQARKIQALEQDLEGHKKVQHQIRSEIEAYQEVERTLRSDLDGHRAVVAEREKEVEEYRKFQDQIRSEIEAYQEGERALQSDLDRHRTELVNREKEVGEYRKALDTVEQDLRGHREALAHARAEAERVQPLEERLREVEQELQEVRDLQAAAEEALREQQIAMHRLTTRMAELCEGIDSSALGPNL